jgi:hypothetical protein
VYQIPRADTAPHETNHDQGLAVFATCHWLPAIRACLKFFQDRPAAALSSGWADLHAPRNRWTVLRQYCSRAEGSTHDSRQERLRHRPLMAANVGSQISESLQQNRPVRIRSKSSDLNRRSTRFAPSSCPQEGHLTYPRIPGHSTPCHGMSAASSRSPLPLLVRGPARPAF